MMQPSPGARVTELNQPIAFMIVWSWLSNLRPPEVVWEADVPQKRQQLELLTQDVVRTLQMHFNELNAPSGMLLKELEKGDWAPGGLACNIVCNDVVCPRVDGLGLQVFKDAPVLHVRVAETWEGKVKRRTTQQIM